MFKKILVSNSGSYQEIEASVDISSNIVSSSINIASNTASFGATNGILQIKNGLISSVPTSNENSGVFLQSSGGDYITASVNVGKFGGDLSGSANTTVYVKNISNVTSGILSSSRGGIGTGSLSSGGLVTTSGSVLTPSANSIIAVDNTNGNLVSVDRSFVDFTPLTSSIVYLYTGSVGTSVAASTVGNFTIPDGCRFIRVVCQGGGGGGAGGNRVVAPTANYGSSGGGGGGYSDITFNALTLPKTPITITAGHGGSGGLSRAAGTTSLIGLSGSNGGSSSFGSYVVSTGGGGGVGSLTTNTTQGAGGFGVIQGGAGGSGSLISSPNLAAESVYIGAPGGGSGARGASNLLSGNRYGRPGGAVLNIDGLQTVTDLRLETVTYDSQYFFEPDTNNSIIAFPSKTTGYSSAAGGREGESAADPTPVYKVLPFRWYLNGTSSANISSNPFPKLISAGGTGGAGSGTAGTSAGSGSTPSFGAGGGAGGTSQIAAGGTAAATGAGGNGGKGYVLIICY